MMYSYHYVLKEWNDYRLRWSSSEYEEDSVRVPVTRVWMPDIDLYNPWVYSQSLFLEYFFYSVMQT